MEEKNKQKEIRLLRAEEIECRVAMINEKGASLLLFKDARVDQKILDETFTPFGWCRSHQILEGNLYCTVSVWDEEKRQWISKQDVGTMSYSEKEKGQASDSFKRACFNWGIGRELYTAPFIWIPAGKIKIQKKGEKFVTSDYFSVKDIAYNERREISALTIMNAGNTVVFSMGQNADKKLKGKIDSMLSTAKRRELEQELNRTGVAIETVLERYHLESIEQMTEEIYEMAIRGLRKSKTKEAA